MGYLLSIGPNCETEVVSHERLSMIFLTDKNRMNGSETQTISEF